MGSADGGVAVASLLCIQVVLNLIVHLHSELRVQISAFVLLLELLLFPCQFFLVIICL